MSRKRKLSWRISWPSKELLTAMLMVLGDFFVVLIVSATVNIVFSADPAQDLAFLASVAHMYPVEFWGIVIPMTLLAFWGGTLTAIKFIESKRDYRSQYLKAVEIEYGYIPLLYDPTKKDKPLSPSVYQRLRFVYDPIPSLSEIDSPEVAMSVEIDDIDKVLKEGRRALIILGWPGGGKTILLRHSMSQRAQNIQKQIGAFLPVYISLPLFAPLVSDPDGIANYLKKHEQALTLTGIENFATKLQEYVKKGEVYLYLDGLDEVGENRQNVVNWIRKQQKSLNLRGALIVGTRFTEYSPRLFFGPDQIGADHEFAVFSELGVQPMDHDIRISLAKELLPEIEEKFDREVPDPTREKPLLESEYFVTLIEQHQQGKLWGGNPLLFTLAAYVYVHDGKLPTSRVTLYRRTIAVLLAKVLRLRQQGGADSLMTNWDVIHLSRMLAEVALKLYDSTSIDAASQRDPRAFTNHTSLSPEQQKSFSGYVLSAVTDRVRDELNLDYPKREIPTWIVKSGTLVPSGTERYTFRHPTYQEYLAAAALARRLVDWNDRLKSEAEQIRQDNRFNPDWSEPMRMLAGALVAESEEGFPDGRALAVKWLQGLIALGQNESAPDHDQALELAVASLSDIPAIDSFATQIDIATLLNLWVAALLKMAQGMQDDTITQQQREHCQDFLGRFQQLAAGVGVLPKRLSEQALARLLRTLQVEQQPELQIAAAQALGGMGNLVTDFTPLFTMLETGRSERVRIAASRALAILQWSDLSYPAHDQLGIILVGADIPLAHIVANSLSVAGHVALPLMQIAVQQGNDPDVRLLGTQALASIGSPARAILNKLKGDTDVAVASAAHEALVRLGADQQTALIQLESQGASTAELDRIAQSALPYTLRQLGFKAKVLNGARVILPPLCQVKAGEFLMGSNRNVDAQALDNELPLHSVALEAFQIGVYPLTVAEYACAVQAGQLSEPKDWSTQLQQLDHPVVHVSWHDVMNYVTWLVQKTGQHWRLPTEAEWEKAARGTDGLIYPWGNPWDGSRANTGESQLRTTTAVGRFADRDDASPCGAHDMAGNVWEWTSTIYKHYKYVATDGREDPKTQGSRVLRGGSWFSPAKLARVTARSSGGQTYADSHFGARLARGGVTG